MNATGTAMAALEAAAERKGDEFGDRLRPVIERLGQMQFYNDFRLVLHLPKEEEPDPLTAAELEVLEEAKRRLEQAGADPAQVFNQAAAAWARGLHAARAHLKNHEALLQKLATVEDLDAERRKVFAERAEYLAKVGAQIAGIESEKASRQHVEHQAREARRVIDAGRREVDNVLARVSRPGLFSSGVRPGHKRMDLPGEPAGRW